MEKLSFGSVSKIKVQNVDKVERGHFQCERINGKKVKTRVKILFRQRSLFRNKNSKT